MDPLVAVLRQLGVDLASQAIYDFVKEHLWRGPATELELAQALVKEFPLLRMDGARVVARTTIDFFARLGLIENGCALHRALSLCLVTVV